MLRALLATVLLALAPAAAPPSRAAAPAARAATAALHGPGVYWLVASDGGIFDFGGAPFEGSAGADHLNAPIVGMAPTADGRGYWLLGRDGSIYNFGDAKAFGSTPALPAPAVGIASTPDGAGYWVVTSIGSVFAFGDAPFDGPTSALQLNKPIVGMAPTADGRGYWLVATDGGIFALGDAAFYGSTGALRLNKPIVGMAATPDGLGYWLVASDGGIFNYGDARFLGSTGAITLNRAVVGMTGAADGGGYWLVASDGGIFSFGDARFLGSTGAITLNKPIVGMGRGPTFDPYTPGTSGYDVSFPQCGSPLPPQPFAMAIVGINNGTAFSHNPCLSTERVWAGDQLTVYMNLNAPPAESPHGLTGPAGTCLGNDTGCMAYNYGYNAAVDAFSYATGQGVSSGLWWLDIETANTWDSSLPNNAMTIQGALDALNTEGVAAGIYSTSYQWGKIAGAYAPGVPIWVATGADLQTAVDYCNPSHGFGSGQIWLTQYGVAGSAFDHDYACPLM